MLAHKLGKDISLDEGNLLRKVLTKKGTGKDKVRKNDSMTSFVAGALPSTDSPSKSKLKIFGQRWNTSPATASTYLTLYPTVRCHSSVRG